MFNDEAVYILWAQKISRNISDLWFPLQTENNKPLHFWLMALCLKFFDDPLWAGRFPSALAGLFSLLGIYCIACRLHSSQAGLIAVFIYTISPYYLLFDRLAHKTALLNCLFVWLLWFAIRMFQPGEKVHAWHYRLYGTLAGLSLLTESTAVLFVFLPLFLNLFKRKTSHAWKPLASACLAGVLVGGFPYAYLHVADKSFVVKNIFMPTYNSMSEVGFADMISAMPLKIIKSVKGVFEYFIAYLPWPVFLSATGYCVLCRKDKSFFVLSSYFILPLFALMGTAGAGFSRYYLFCATPLLLWSALGLAEASIFLKRVFPKSFYPALAFILPLGFSQALTFDYNLLTHPPLAPLLEKDHSQYINGEYSGYGSLEAVDYFRKASNDKKIAVFTTSNWGVPDDAMSIYLSTSPNIDIHTSFWLFNSPLLPPDLEILDSYNKFTGKLEGKFDVKNLPSDVYLVARTPSVPRGLFLEKNTNFELVESFVKPGGINSIDIYKRIKSKPPAD